MKSIQEKLKKGSFDLKNGGLWLLAHTINSAAFVLLEHFLTQFTDRFWPIYVHLGGLGSMI